MKKTTKITGWFDEINKNFISIDSELPVKNLLPEDARKERRGTFTVTIEFEPEESDVC